MLLLAGIITLLLNLTDCGINTLIASADNLGIEATGSNRQEGGVELHGIIDLIPCKTDSRHNVGGGVRLREHVLNLLAGPDIPIGHTVLYHSGLPIRLKSLTLSYRLHDVEGELTLKTVGDKIKHNTVTCTHNLGNCAGACLNKLLGITEPYVCSVSQSRNLEKIGKVLWLRLQENLLKESGTKLGNTEGSKLASANIRGSDAKGPCRLKELVYGLIIHLNVKNARIGILLKHLVLGGNIVSKLVKLQNRIMKIGELEVGCYGVCIGVIGRMLHGCEIVNIILVRHYDNTTGMLTRGLLNTHNSGGHVADLRLGNLNSLILKVLGNIAPGRLIGKAGGGSGTEHVSVTEELLGIFMYLTLHVTREVKVDIRRLITVEAKEGLKGNVVAVLIKHFTADGTLLIGKIKSRANRAVCKELRIATLRTSVMGRQRVNLRNTRHRGNEGGAYRAT